MKTFDELMIIFYQLSLMTKLLDGEEKLNCVLEMVDVLNSMKECCRC